MATPNTTDSTATPAGLSPSAPKADASPCRRANRPAFAGKPFADPTLLTPDERLAAFGRMLARAVERRRARLTPTHSTKQDSKQKRN